MKRFYSVMVWCVGGALVVCLAYGLAGCGHDSTRSCDCAICINDQPAYPSDSQASCDEFGQQFDCSSILFTSDPSEQCGDQDMPHCEVSGCTLQCECPPLDEGA